MGAKVIESMIGLVMKRVHGRDDMVEMESDDMLFHLEHIPECCESVTLEDICGDLFDLEGSPIVEAECVTDTQAPPPDGLEGCESHTWTFYKFRTAKGAVTFRWFGESNGYYGEEVSVLVARRGKDGDWQTGHEREDITP